MKSKQPKPSLVTGAVLHEVEGAAKRLHKKLITIADEHNIGLGAGKDSAVPREVRNFARLLRQADNLTELLHKMRRNADG